MPKILISEASVLALNVLAAFTFNKDWDAEGMVVNCTYPSDHDGWIYSPATDPSQAEEHILGEKIAWRCLSTGVWQAMRSVDLGDAPGAQWKAFDVEPTKDGKLSHRKQLFEGPTPLVAAMRCAIAARHQADEIHLPMAVASRLVEALEDRNEDVPASLLDSMPGDCLAQLCDETDTEPEDWEPMDGPTTGVGEEYWYRHHDGREAYICDDQTDITVEVSHPTDRETQTQ